MAKAIFEGLAPPDDPLFKTVTIFTLPRGRKRPQAVSQSDQGQAGKGQKPATGERGPEDVRRHPVE